MLTLLSLLPSLLAPSVQQAPTPSTAPGSSSGPLAPSSDPTAEAREALETLEAAKRDLEAEIASRTKELEGLEDDAVRRNELTEQLEGLALEEKKLQSALATQRAQLEELERSIVEREEVKGRLEAFIDKHQDLANRIEAVEAEKIVVSAYQEVDQSQQQQRAPSRELLLMQPNGVTVGSLVQKARARATDHCIVNVASETGSTDLADLGLDEILFRQTNKGQTRVLFQRKAPTTGAALELNSDDLCNVFVQNKASPNAPVEMELVYKSSSGRRSERYKFRFQKRSFRFELGVSTYFAGGLSADRTRSSFAIFPALRASLGANLPLAGDPDFHLSGGPIVGGGFVVVETEDSGSGESALSDDTQRLSLFVGGSFSIGRYLEIGYAYDPLNNNHLLLFSPSSIFGATLFQTPQ